MLQSFDEYESDSAKMSIVTIPTKEQETPSFANQQVKTPRETVKNQFTHSQKPKVDKKELGYGFIVKACFVCRSLNHLIRDCDFHEKRMARKAELNNGWNKKSSQRELRQTRNNVQGVNKQNQFVLSAVLTRTGKIPVSTARASGTKNVSTARQSVNSQRVLTSTAMKVNTVKPIVNRVRPANIFHKTHLPSSRLFKKTTILSTNFLKQKVNTAKENAVSAVGGKRETAVKTSTGCNWRPQRYNWHNDYPHRALKNKGIIDSGCSRHMTGNKAYLAEFQDFNGGPVAFGGSKGYITGKGKIKTGGLACLIAKATTDESNKWHRRLGHVNFKNLNKLVKGNLVRGLPSKIFQNDHTCVACQKGQIRIKREYSNARTPQQNGVAERKNMTLIEAARTMLADSFLPNTFWAEAVSTACYVLNRVLVTKPHNKTPYELLTGQQKANQNASTKDIINAGDSEKEDEFAEDCLVLPIWSSYSSPITLDLKTDEKREGSREEEQEYAQETENLVVQAGVAKASSTNIFSTVSTPAKDSSINLVKTVSIPVSTASPHEGLSLSDPINPEQDDSEIPPLEDIYQTSTDGIFTNSSYDDEGAVADFTNLETIVNVSPIPTSRFISSHPSALILGDLTSAVQNMKGNDLPFGKKAIAQSRFYRNKTDERGVVVINKARCPGLKPKDLFKHLPHTWGFIDLVKGCENAFLIGKIDRRSMIGSLMYLTPSRPGILMFAGKPKLGLWYLRVSSFDLESYSDSDYAGANLDRKSTTGGCQFLGRRLIFFGCAMQNAPIVATSYYIGKDVAAASYCGQVLWIQNQMLDYGFNFMNTKIYIDNESTICIVKNPDLETLDRVIDGTEALLIPTLFILWLDTVSTDSAKLVPLGKVCTAIETLKKHTAKGTKCKHNMVAYLEKSEGNAEFHEIIDFLTRSSIHHALTVSPVVSTTFVEQFWTSAKSKIINNVRHITAKVAGKPVSISEASIRSDLLFDDANGIDSLPNQAIFDAIQLMGHLDAKKKFVMYPRFISIFLDKQLANVPVPLDHFPVNALTSKVFSFMVKKGKHFSGKVTPLFASMLVQPTEDEVKYLLSHRLTNTPRPSPSTIIPDSIPESSVGILEINPKKIQHLKVSDKNLKKKAIRCKSPPQSMDAKYLLGSKYWQERDPKNNRGSATQTTQPPPTSTIIGEMSEIIAKVNLNMSKPKPFSRREGESESDGIPEVEKKFKQLVSDEEMARKVQEEWESEEERNRLAEEKAITKEALIRNYDDIKARIEADRLLVEKIQEEEREQFTIEERAKFLHDTIAAQRKFPCQQRDQSYQEQTYLTQESNDEDKFWNSQQDWNIVSWKLHGSSGVHTLVTEAGLVIHMLVEKKYPLRKKVLLQMLELKLESEEDSTMALELIRFVKKLVAELEPEDSDGNGEDL
ncbi:ribonuclease H-like domain-containing protein [Tanacetum coccineum]